MKTLSNSLILLVVLVTTSLAQGLVFHGGIRNSVYNYESNEKHTLIYQYAHLNIASSNQKIQVYSSFRLKSDANVSIPDSKRFQAFNFYAKFSQLFNEKLNLSVGRLFIHPGTPVGNLDGVVANVFFQPNIALIAYAGYQTNYLRNFDNLTDDPKVGGIELKFKNIPRSQISLLYLQKANDSETLWQLAGLNVNSRLGKSLIKFQTHYDLKNEQIHRFLLSGRYPLNEKLQVNAEIKQQHPQIYANSFYTIFQIDPYTQYRAGLSYDVFSNYYIQAQIQHIKFDSETANRLYFTLNNANGSLGLLYENGYSGNQLSVMFDYAVEIYQNLLLSAMVDYSHYRLEEIYEYENQLGNALRLSYHFNKHLSIDAEYQWLTSKFKDSDNRFLNHILYRW